LFLTGTFYTKKAKMFLQNLTQSIPDSKIKTTLLHIRYFCCKNAKKNSLENGISQSGSGMLNLSSIDGP